mgnify:CR=1 FL=1|jgi:hypothetical protein
MLYTFFVLFSGIYLGQEFDILPSVRIIVGNLMVYLRRLPDPVRPENVVNATRWFENVKKYFF